MAPISEEERAQRARQVANARASVRMEGLEPGPEAEAIFDRYVDGELTFEEMGAAIDELHDREFGPVRLSGDDGS